MLIAVGMACVSGSTLVAYATILAGVLPNAASHVLIASIISAPAGVLLARIMVPRDPETEAAGQLDHGTDKVYESSIDALIKGTGDGLNNLLAAMISFRDPLFNESDSEAVGNEHGSAFEETGEAES